MCSHPLTTHTNTFLRNFPTDWLQTADTSLQSISGFYTVNKRLTKVKCKALTCEAEYQSNKVRMFQNATCTVVDILLEKHT